MRLREQSFPDRDVSSKHSGRPPRGTPAQFRHSD